MGRALGRSGARRRRRRAPRRGDLPAPQAAGRHPSGGLHRSRRIGRQSRTLPRQQLGQEPRADRRRHPSQGRGLRVLQHLRRLRPAAVRPAGRGAQDRADQSLRRLQGERGARPGGRDLARPALGFPALLQRHGRRRRRRDRRGARAGDPSAAARRRCRARPARGPDRARRGLPDPGRLVRARFRACLGSCRCPSQGRAMADAPETRSWPSRRVQPGLRRRIQRQAGGPGDRPFGRPAGTACLRRAPAGGFAPTGGLHRQGAARFGMDALRGLETQIEDTVRWRRAMVR